MKNIFITPSQATELAESVSRIDSALSDVGFNGAFRAQFICSLFKGAAND